MLNVEALQRIDPRTVPDVREQMNVVIVGHVDHGKSTLVGRLLADTGGIDPAKLEKVRALCERQGKQFEHSFLLDALEAEQAQGITIDAARCFFKSQRRDYLIIDAPGHIEFLKNMVTGAARAEAAILLIDAAEGVRENSRRHGYLLAMLGIRQIVVAVNKMDRVGYDKRVFEEIRSAYGEFLGRIDVHPAAFIPVSAREGDLVVGPSTRVPWYHGPSILQAMDAFAKAPAPEDRPLRLPVQDVYRFNRMGDTRRIIAGRITSGRLRVGDEVQFLPSGKRTRVASIEAFSADPQHEAAAGASTGITVTEEVYVQRGDVLCPVHAAPRVSDRIRANVFWLGRAPLRPGRTYKLKLATWAGLCEVEQIVGVIDASELAGAGHRDRVERHEVAEVVLRLRRTIACDLSHEAEDTARFVLVDGYDVAGGGIVREVLEAAAGEADDRWTAEAGAVGRPLRELKNGHRALLAVVYDDREQTGQSLAAALEESLWADGRAVYRLALGADDVQKVGPGELALRSVAGGVVAALLHTGQVVVATVPWSDHLAHDEALSLPGMPGVPRLHVRFRVGPASADGNDCVLDPSRDPRALHDEVKDRLRALAALR